MKILLLNPKVNAKHEIARSLLRKGVAFLFPENSDDALQMLEFHGDTIDLAIIHREGLSGKGDLGLRFVEKLKLNSTHKDLPIILTTEVWDDAACASHQNGPAGVNAYLHSPFSERELVAICEAVLGQPIVNAEAGPSTQNRSSSNDSSLPILEEASEVFKKSDLMGSSRSISIQLEGFGLSPAKPPVMEESSAVAPQEFPEPSLEENGVEASGRETSAADPVKIEVLSQDQPPPQQAEGFEVSEAPDMSGSSLEVSGPPAMSNSPEVSNSPEIPIEPKPPSEEPLQFEVLDAPQFEAVPPELESIESIESLTAIFSKGREAQPNLDTPSPKPLSAGDSQPAVDSQVAEEMPYLVPGYNKKNRAAFDPSLLFAEALGDAVVPGGAAQAPDLETFKKYLMLREQDVAVLSNQLKAAHDQLAASEQLLKEEKTQQAELTYLVSEQKKKIEEFEKGKNSALDRLRAEVEDLTFQLKTKTDKSRILDRQVRETVEEMEHLKIRVRTDIRKIRVREKELENRLEMNKKDSEALIAARENKIIELKRKLDVLEFNMDLLQDQYSKEKENSTKLRERLIKAAQVVRVAGGLLDSNKEGRELIHEVSDEENSGEEGLKAS